MKHATRTTGPATAAATALSAALLTLTTPTTSHADTFIPLPGGETTETLGDGTTITVRLTGESALISPSMGATPLHRNTWASATATADASTPPRAMTIRPGYIVGCQINIAGGGATTGLGLSQRTGSDTAELSANGGANLSLGPGQAKKFYVLDLEAPDAFGDETHRPFNRVMSPHGSVTWKNTTIGLTGCAGYAQARTFVQVDIETSNAKEIITLWGQPFSLG
ncbi:MspA family porin [Nocardia goodfellowii]